jgi:hypothetical protein
VGNSTVVLPPPYKGQNDKYPLIAIQNPFCERMKNFNNLNSKLSIRQGHDLWATVTDAAFIGLHLDSYNDTTPELFLLLGDGATNWKWYDVTSSGSGTLDHTDTATGVAPASFFFNNILIYTFGQSGRVEVYNGTAWTSDPYTFSSFAPYGGTAFKNRAYFIKYRTASYGYGPIDGITGTVTEVNLASQITSGAQMYMIRPVSLTQNLTAESVLAFIFSSGEILVYSGSYPDSDSWAIISRFKISKPIQYNAYVDAKGDSILFTESEILSLRNLFVSGYDKEREDGIGATINKRWRQCIEAYRNAGAMVGGLDGFSFIKGVYDEKNDRIVISMPKYVDPSTGAITAGITFQLIYDFNLDAWYEYTQTDEKAVVVTSATYFNNAVFLCVLETAGVAYVVELEGGANFLDDQLDGSGTNPIDYKLTTAPLPISKFGANEISGVEVICKSDLYPQTNYKFIADLGRQESGNQVLPAQGTGIEKPMMNVGIQGAITAQLDISGSTVSSSIGLELYAFNVWYSQGEKGSR